jgi:anti-sigma regulatory factor (Ser/Thr protein kinase)
MHHERRRNEMAHSPDWSHTTVLTPEPMSAVSAREFVELHLRTHGLGHLAEDLQLVASELATNAVTHARTPLLITLSRVDGSVLLVVEDSSASMPVRRSPGAEDVGGRSLLLVAALSQDWGTSTDGNENRSVWASFPIGATGGRPGRYGPVVA